MNLYFIALKLKQPAKRGEKPLTLREILVNWQKDKRPLDKD
jgi:hypothetical protein